MHSGTMWRLSRVLICRGISRAALTYHPRFRAASTDEGMKILDYSNPQAVAYLNDLLSELLPSSPSRNSIWEGRGVLPLMAGAEGITQRFPKLLAYAKKHAAAGESNDFDGFMYFLNQQYAVVKALGKTDVRVWNDALYWKVTTERSTPRSMSLTGRWRIRCPVCKDGAPARPQDHQLQRSCLFTTTSHTLACGMTDRPRCSAFTRWVPGTSPAARRYSALTGR
ncbi:MAG: hypothetical protein U1U88_000749 [Lawsonella clevelandensis]